MNNLLTGFALAAASLLPACAIRKFATNVAVVDTTWGHEHISADRAVHLSSTRVRLHEERHEGDGLVYPFCLCFELTNQSDTVWSVERDHFTVRVAEGRQDVGAKIALAPGPIVQVPRESAASLTLPIELVVRNGKALADVEDCALELTFDDGTPTTLKKRIGVGTFNQIGQGSRVVFLVTAGLVVLSVL